jgi:hypothetical protein
VVAPAASVSSRRLLPFVQSSGDCSLPADTVEKLGFSGGTNIHEEFRLILSTIVSAY